MVHNGYQQRGGEDSVVEAEIQLLRESGNKVTEYSRHNDEIKQLGKLAIAHDTVWSNKTVAEVAELVTLHRLDIIHVHNTFPLISPSIYWAASRENIPIVQTLHNFRFLCPQAMFLRDGAVCEDCLGKVPWRGVVRKCYRDSILQSAVLASSITFHKAVGTYRNKVTRYIALNEFSRKKFIAGGIPENKISVKPNFIDCAAMPHWDTREGGLFVGRLSKEKGLDVLAAAVKVLIKNPVKVVGGGELQDFAVQSFGDKYLGFQSLENILGLMSRSTYLVISSVCYEQFPRTIAEAFACGLPVIASRLGALAEIVDDGRTGLLFESGNAQDLAKKIAWAEAHPNEMMVMGRAARKEYEDKYTSQRNYDLLMNIYEDAIEHN